MKTLYEIIIVPSSDDERRFEEEANNWKEANELWDKIKLEDDHGALSYYSFNSKKERDAFIQGYMVALGFLGNGLYYTNEIEQITN